uniref:F-box domain-containing protein n=1 Tax=Psilocybe cubensis TaxID=181762 RepID=A0A8H7Y4J7_PSICU
MSSSPDILHDEQRLDDIKRRLDDLERGLHSLQIQHDALASQSATLAANVAARRVKNAPMRTLLPEICDIVFAYCADPECALDCDISDCVFEQPSPVVLASVCCRWRAMVYNNPALWTTLHLRPDINSPAEITRARLFLKRSANMPLRVTICPVTLLGDPRSITACVLPVLSVLIPHFGRVQSLKTHLSIETLPDVFPAAQDVLMPMLQELSLLVNTSHASASLLGRLQARRLQVLHVCDITPFLDVLDDVLPTLKSLVITECRSWKFSRLFPNMLAKCSKLQSCSITFPSTLFFMDLEPIELPELRSLNLEWPFLFEPSPIFRALRAPKLLSLRITHLSRQLVVPIHTLSSLKGLLRSAAQLQFLAITGCNLLTQDEATRLFEDSPNIRRLEINNCSRGDRFLLPLTPDNPRDIDAVWLCPKLTHVTITGLQDSDVRPVINFAKSRSDIMATTVPANPECKFLEELALDTNSQHLNRQAKLLLLSGLFGIQRSLNILGPRGNLFSPPT